MKEEASSTTDTQASGSTDIEANSTTDTEIPSNWTTPKEYKGPNDP